MQTWHQNVAVINPSDIILGFSLWHTALRVTQDESVEYVFNSELGVNWSGCLWAVCPVCSLYA